VSAVFVASVVLDQLKTDVDLVFVPLAESVIAIVPPDDHLIVSLTKYIPVEELPDHE
jgi:hypothetical protein